MQCHLGRNALQSLHREVCRAHPRLDRSERVFDRRAPRAHSVGICIEPALHSLEQTLMFQRGDPAVYFRRAMALERAGSARIRPVTAQPLSMLLGGEVVF